MYCLVPEKPLRLAPQGHFLRGVYGTFYLAPQGHFLRAPSMILLRDYQSLQVYQFCHATALLKQSFFMPQY
jgi:hypothetical protein